MEPLEIEQNTEKMRATEIDTGAALLSMENVMLGLPQKLTESRSFSSTVAQPWDYGELMSQRKLMATLNITPDTPTDKPLWFYTNSFQQVMSTHFRNLSDLFLVKSWTLNFLFEFRSNFQQVGLCNLVYTNLPQILQHYLLPKTSFDTFTMQTQMPHRLVFMGEDQEINISLKWLSPFVSAPTAKFYQIHPTPAINDDYDMGTLFLTVPFPMEVAAGVDSTMTVRIWSHLSDVTYAGYSPTDKIL
nr:MAG: hypothetical protein [Wufeng shrew polycipivirus 5]